ncbi:MAG: MmcQ/YjbR family DNA-binding protein [Clostridiales bacterium]|nr:MmcQ/YjbR family DNA-binding protein [Clostridiales bacterium]
MTRRELIDLCLELPQSYEDYPFDDVTPVIRHEANKKMFALVGEKDGRLSISLKCDPFEADLLRRIFKDVNPGYHFNKTHWNTVTLGGDVPPPEVKRQIEASYGLTKPKMRKRKPDEGD